MRRLPSPGLAAILSFVLPGLGQLSLGRVRRAAVVAAPLAVLLGAALAALTVPLHRLIDIVVRPEVLIGLLVLNVALLVYHVAAIVDAYALAAGLRAVRSRRQRPAAAPRPGPATAVLALVVALTVLLHGGVEYLGVRAYATLDTVFAPGSGGSDGGIPEPAPSGEPTPTPAPGTTPAPTPAPDWASDGRLNLLLIGSDAGPGRTSLRTDTMIVLSVDLATDRAALFGIPRNLVGVPLPPESADAFPDGRFPDLLNALYRYAMEHPRAFPGGEARGFRAVAGAVQELVGVRLDGMVGVNLAGFVQLVDALGGLWVDVPERLVDPHYPVETGGHHIRIEIEPGCQHFDGRMALAYARSRNQDSDYFRMRRQQITLLALRRQVDPIALLPRVPELLDIAQENLWTTMPRSAIGPLAELASKVRANAVETITFVPPRYPSHVTNASIARMHRVVRNVFDESPAASASPSAEPSGGAEPSPTNAPCPPA